MNPLLDFDTYIPDVEAHVFNGKVYLYGSHDEKGGERFCMLDYEFFSTDVDDLEHFKSDGISYSKNEDVIHRVDKEKLVDYYAPDCVKGNDGYYYLYYSAMGPNTKPFGPISVAKSSSPSGPFKYYGDIKYKNGKAVLIYLNNDPAVINDNGRIFLYYGWGLGRDFRNKFLSFLYNFVLSKISGRSIKEIKNTKSSILSCAFVEIDSNDMLTALDKPKAVLDSKTSADKNSDLYKHPFYEAPSIRKFNDWYYLIYSSGENGELCYAKSNFPDKGFEYGGVLISSADLGYDGSKISKDIYGTIHGSIEMIKDSYYLFYHRLSNQSDFQRRVCAEKINMDSSGNFAQVEMTTNGLSNYIGKGKIEAIRAANIYNENTGRRKKKLINAPYSTFDEKEHFITNIIKNSHIVFKYFSFVNVNKISVNLRGISKGSLTLKINNKTIDKIDIHPSLSWEKYDFVLNNLTSGKASIEFEFNSKKSIDFLNFEIN